MTKKSQPALDKETRDIDDDEIATVLAGSGLEWTAPEEQSEPWLAVATGSRGLRYPLAVRFGSRSVEVTGVIAPLDSGLSERSRKAMSRFLNVARDQLRPTSFSPRFVLQGRQAIVVSSSPIDRFEIGFPDQVRAVITACRLVSNELRALANDQLAEAYLEPSRST